jgi:hypothetical protein
MEVLKSPDYTGMSIIITRDLQLSRGSCRVILGELLRGWMGDNCVLGFLMMSHYGLTGWFKVAKVVCLNREDRLARGPFDEKVDYFRKDEVVWNHPRASFQNIE